MRKLADLLPGVKLQPHQKRLEEESEESPVRKLLMHSLGSGKTLTAIGMAEAGKEPYTAVVPAALRPNFMGEQQKWTNEGLPGKVMSYTELAQGKPPGGTGTLIFDEAHRLRNPDAAQAREAKELARKANRLVMLTGTPIVNAPGDLAVATSMLTGKDISPAQFEKRYVGERKVYPSLWRRLVGWSSGSEPSVEHEKELKALLKGHIDYYDPGRTIVPVKSEEVVTTMGVEQSQLYNAMWDRLPFWLRWKLRHDFPLSRDELRRTQSFLAGPRQVGLSTYPYLRDKDPEKAFAHSTKLQEAHKRMLHHLKDPRTKALVFANFIDAGLVPYSHALTKAGVPNAVFHGGLSDVQRRKLVEDYNDGKIRVALLGPSGTEGLSFKGTQLVQQLDPHWQAVRGKQAVGRGLRYDSHVGLPPELQNVKVERYVARLPLGLKDRILKRIGFDESAKERAADDYLKRMEARKELLNRKFMALLKDVGSEGKAAQVGLTKEGRRSHDLDMLLLAKAESDRGNYGAKHSIMRDLIRAHPEHFRVDSEEGGFVGLTHRTNFRMHLPKHVLPVPLRGMRHAMGGHKPRRPSFRASARKKAGADLPAPAAGAPEAGLGPHVAMPVRLRQLV
jgi:superfamily II DNA or RNA helicase